jgi:hypothetical protein
MVPMLDSPHEDVRSYSLVALPEFIRATGKATSPSRVALNTITEYAIGLLITAVEKEGALELIMTALQAMKLVLQYGSQDWAAWALLTGSDGPSDPPKSTLTAALHLDAPIPHTLKKPLGTDEPPAPTPETSIHFLNAEQMVAIAQSAKVMGYLDNIYPLPNFSHLLQMHCCCSCMLIPLQLQYATACTSCLQCEPLPPVLSPPHRHSPLITIHPLPHSLHTGRVSRFNTEEGCLEGRGTGGSLVVRPNCCVSRICYSSR